MGRDICENYFSRLTAVVIAILLISGDISSTFTNVHNSIFPLSSESLVLLTSMSFNLLIPHENLYSHFLLRISPTFSVDMGLETGVPASENAKELLTDYGQ
jgi:hypothetical protein